MRNVPDQPALCRKDHQAVEASGLRHRRAHEDRCGGLDDALTRHLSEFLKNAIDGHGVASRDVMVGHVLVGLQPSRQGGEICPVPGFVAWGRGDEAFRQANEGHNRDSDARRLDEQKRPQNGLAKEWMNRAKQDDDFACLAHDD
jgi:hypothetical protein